MIHSFFRSYHNTLLLLYFCSHIAVLELQNVSAYDLKLRYFYIFHATVLAVLMGFHDPLQLAVAKECPLFLITSRDDQWPASVRACQFFLVLGHSPYRPRWSQNWYTVCFAYFKIQSIKQLFQIDQNKSGREKAVAFAASSSTDFFAEQDFATYVECLYGKPALFTSFAEALVEWEKKQFCIAQIQVTRQINVSRFGHYCAAFIDFAVLRLYQFVVIVSVRIAAILRHTPVAL